MEYKEHLTRYMANFVDELAKTGLTDVVISPGSRSTPLAMTMAEHPTIKEWIILDERSAAFFGLGLAKQTKRAVALVCSSGTAAANYFPAIVEAYQSRVPLVVLTADRPHELRDVGAPQAIDQIKLYGDYVKWFQEMSMPEATPAMLAYVRKNAARAVQTAQGDNAGPVHLNFPFREPLIPDFTVENLWGETTEESYAPVIEGQRVIPENMICSIIGNLQLVKRGVIVCGPQVDEELGQAITKLAALWKLPILADPLSQVRAGNHPKNHIIEGYDAFLRNKHYRKKLKPDFIIRFGAMPVSKPYLFYVQENQDAKQYVVENHGGHREPVGNRTEFIYSDPVSFCTQLIEQGGDLKFSSNWLQTWKNMNHITKKHLTDVSGEALTEGSAVRKLISTLPNESSLYVGNSMAVRDVDTFFLTTSKNIYVLANRGANGIDGIISSALGAAATGTPVTLVLGDLSFFHDLNGLLASKHYQLNITILLINNNGGGIFSFLPQASERKHFEALFGTPVNLDFKQAVDLYGGYYHKASNEMELEKALRESYQESGLSVVEVITNREENVTWHRNLWADINNDISKSVVE
ncbi:2-succinyl-5-enolpyruvyl-6-hydroxy-3-cyclohexene-1-carboxylic-acid synthase [Ornithinibacillus sp. L9]|uniref:2-succinyl-5-enolpyruvyl-6-hydroxy-3-cyclohexene-1-carboxylate synthase n=1 Tax=Ornithinibacillus caprae TaxID=2678566 RepID=A0A6N8FKY3_9BACI|nr:2-succinyl-5-enolpyruvyl-6-hydroxy-3-cyclohexene-1-carboxylic-acid synthase [Ornithinibacillus caprae]MUK90043.1 2-succinyl-5-enolpyruvyl-6-hydroxy-3-cyclohexene-1-carboxylic-acid synthase [Ornithinibacillus caprae]